MNKIINYYDILKKIKNIKFIRVDIRIKCNKVSKVVKLMIVSKRSLKYYLYQCNVPKSTFFDNATNIVSNNELKLINCSRPPKKTNVKYNWDEIHYGALKMQNHDITIMLLQLDNSAES